jgi:hypothetical protein
MHSSRLCEYATSTLPSASGMVPRKWSTQNEMRESPSAAAAAVATEAGAASMPMKRAFGSPVRAASARRSSPRPQPRSTNVPPAGISTSESSQSRCARTSSGREDMTGTEGRG